MRRILGFIHRYVKLLIAFSITIILFIVHLNLRTYAFDDAYIHFRVAMHLAEFGEPYFNLGEAVMASSSTGWTILLSLCIRSLHILDISVDPPILVSLINTIASTAGAYLYTTLFTRLVQRPTSWAFKIIFFIAYLGMILPASVGLMETPTVMLLAGLALLLLMNRNRWSLVIIGSLPFFRPELAVVTGLLGLFILYTKRFLLKEVLFCYILGALPFVLFELYFFKTLIPNTMIAKSVVYSLTYIATFKYFIEKIFDDLALLGMIVNISLVQKLYFAGFELWVIVSVLVINIYKAIRQYLSNKLLEEKDVYSLLLISWCGIIVSIYLYKQVFIFNWYDPLYTVPLLLLIGKTISDEKSKGVTLASWIMVLPLLLGQLSSLAQVGMGAFIDPRYTPEFLICARVRNYIDIGRKLYDQFPDAKLMTAEIGGLGYGFKGYIYDGVGLVSPDALKYHPINPTNNYGGIPAGFVEEKQPDLIVSYDVFMQDLLESRVLDGYAHYRYPLLLEDDMQRTEYELFFKSEFLNVFVSNDLLP